MVVSFAGKELELLKQENKRTLQYAYAEGSFANFANQWVKFLSFCVDFSLVAFPATCVVRTVTEQTPKIT